MKLEQLFLTKEELPILYSNCFQIPIHPKLLNSSIKINPLIAKRIFPQVAEEWYNDLKEYVKKEKDSEKKEWYENVFLKEELNITKENNRQFFGIWEDQTQTQDNGFVNCFSISRNAGGSLYFNGDDLNCKSFGITYIKFSDEKRKEFQFENKFNQIYVYSQHNVDAYPGALFLRNWAIKYMNEVFKQVF